MTDKKNWYKSKTIWGGIYVCLRTLYTAIQGVLAPELGWSLPDIPPVVDVVVGGIVGEEIIRGRVKANTKIGNPDA